ncbi:MULTISPECIES: mechanosensitive ion channel family protein [unclassified Leifsonia]|uniref:mechanosensitive ion channel family protein n=1 Tax=unclassified Leifsonia TaxID=2663824 RepID=UPI0006FE2A43|nr:MULTISPECIES: mechanosensitive ion channel domain-containing protein [unclassified Leifsonia]KQX08318.1 mechanosensitive ion channel protein MscS [Leifsonia sp. Root1293]KRA12601.1 mechanosensitive ion channel protein MscS [Leifsonia sp. Root60]
MLDGFEWQSWLGFGVAVLIAAVAALVITAIARQIARAVGRHKEWPRILLKRARWPFRLLLFIAGLWIVLVATLDESEVRAGFEHLLLIAMIVVGSWFVCELALFGMDLSTSRYRIDVADNKVARRVRTQIAILRRLVVVVAVVVAIGGVLLSFPEVRLVGASVLASAGLLSVVAGLAAQSTLANLFAGIQLAFSEAIRVDDVVVVEGEWGKIGEITLSYVVVNLWDERNLVLPCTYFTTQPFQNWTREGSALLGSVELDLDWRIAPALMREQLAASLERTELWDQRASVLQVTDAVGGFVRVRILVTAADAPTLFDLRCYVREEMVAWVQTQHPTSIPHQRVLVDPVEAGAPEAEPARAEKKSPRRPEPEPFVDVPSPHTGEQANLFSGSPEAEERASMFTSAIPIQTGASDQEVEETLDSDGR